MALRTTARPCPPSPAPPLPPPLSQILLLLLGLSIAAAADGVRRSAGQGSCRRWGIGDIRSWSIQRHRAAFFSIRRGRSSSPACAGHRSRRPGARAARIRGRSRGCSRPWPEPERRSRRSRPWPKPERSLRRSRPPLAPPPPPSADTSGRSRRVLPRVRAWTVRAGRSRVLPRVRGGRCVQPQPSRACSRPACVAARAWWPPRAAAGRAGRRPPRMRACRHRLLATGRAGRACVVAASVPCLRRQPQFRRSPWISSSPRCPVAAYALRSLPCTALPSVSSSYSRRCR